MMRDTLTVPDTLRFHGKVPVRGSEQVTQSSLEQGRFGRLFRKLDAAPDYDEDTLRALAESMRDVDAPVGWNGTIESRDNPDIAAGYTYFGQFIDHDLTFDPASSLQRKNDVDALRDFRSPRFDLDSIYGSGPADEPFQYVRGTKGLALLFGPNTNGIEDLPRNSEDIALIGDPRNDENVIVSQLQLVFLKLHSKVGAEVAADASIEEDKKFEEAQRRVRWHYQWVVLFDYLPKVIGKAAFDRIVKRDRQGRIKEITRPNFEPRNNAYMPVEFSAAAFRFGHSMIRGIYDLNEQVTARPIFTSGPMVDPTADLRGFRALPAFWTAHWPLFLPIGGSTPQPSRKIDARLVPPLFDIPGLDGPSSLAFRNLKRGQMLGLPGGQDVARRLNVQVLGAAELEAPDPTPLWFYILKEAELLAEGKHLGPVGGQIVGQVLAGLLELDPTSFYNVDRTWAPTIAPGRNLSLPDLVAFAIA